MPGKSVPLVLLPRFSTLAGGTDGTQDFTTIPIDVSPYDGATVTVWRGKVIGDETPAPPPPPPPPYPIEFYFEESTDQATWTLCDGSLDPPDPGENFQFQSGMTLTKRWFRLRVHLEYDATVVSCWAAGYFTQRLT